MSMSGLLQDQKKFQLDLNEHPWGNSFQYFRLKNPEEIIS